MITRQCIKGCNHVQMKPVSAEMELRHLSDPQIIKLSQILDSNEIWKPLMGKIPKKWDNLQIDTDFNKISLKYTADDIRDIEKASKELHRSPSLILLDEWGTSGQKRATVQNLLDLLVRVPLYRAADFVAKDILKTTEPKRPETGPAAPIDVSLPAIGSSNSSIHLPIDPSTQSASEIHSTSSESTDPSALIPDIEILQLSDNTPNNENDPVSANIPNPSGCLPNLSLWNGSDS